MNATTEAKSRAELARDAAAASQGIDSATRRLMRRWSEAGPEHREIVRRLLAGEPLDTDLTAPMARVLLGGRNRH